MFTWNDLTVADAAAAKQTQPTSFRDWEDWEDRDSNPARIPIQGNTAGTPPPPREIRWSLHTCSRSASAALGSESVRSPGLRSQVRHGAPFLRGDAWKRANALTLLQPGTMHLISPQKEPDHPFDSQLSFLCIGPYLAI